MLRLIERSTESAISLEEMKQHLKREDTNEDDEYIDACTKAATEWAERFMGVALVDQTWDEFFDAFPTTGPLYLRKGPLLEIIGAFARDSAEVEFTGFFTDIAGGSIYLGSTGTWPNVDGASNAVRVRYRVGYVDTSGSPIEDLDVPELVKAAVKLYAASLYGVREGGRPNDDLKEMLRPFKIDDSLA